MANETNKNRDDRKDKLGNPTSGKSGMNPVGKAPLRGDYSNPDDATSGDNPGMVPRGSGRRGNISTEDGGDVSGSSSGSH